VLSHAAFARELSENGALESDLLLRAREGLQQTLRLLAQVRRKEEILAQGRAAAGEGTEESEQRFFASRRVMEEETAEMLGDEENDLDFGRES
jgi:hypothetical protein